jgi:phospholipid/cholesterol/gamma-HCH transport system substrate-binding protein
MRQLRLAPVAVALASLVVAVLVLRSGSDGYVVKAQFRDAAGLRKNSSVKVGGVPGGTITKLDLGPGDLAVATMRLDDGVTVGDGARAHVRPVNLLGEKYIELIPGDFRDRPWASGKTIAAAHTSAPVELDDVLNVLRPDTRTALRVLINEAGVAMAGRGADFNDLLDQLPPSLDQTTRVISAFASDTRRLGDLVSQGDRVLDSVTAKRNDLNDLVDEAGKALQATADRRVDLGASVRAAGPTAQQLRATLTALHTTAANLVPAARGLRATTSPLRDTLDRLPAFVKDVGPLLATATAVAPDLRRLGADAAPTVRRLRPTAARLSTFARRLAPLVRTADQAGALDGLLGVMNGWVRTTQNSDGLGHLFRLRLQVDDTATSHLLDALGLNPTADQKRSGNATSRPAEPAHADGSGGGDPPPAAATAAPDASSSKPTLPVPQIPGTTLDDKLGGPQAGGVGALLDYLLGG